MTKTKTIRTAYTVTTTFAKLIPKPTMSPDGPIKCMQRQKHPLYCTLGFKRANENRGSRSREASFRDTTPTSFPGSLSPRGERETLGTRLTPPMRGQLNKNSFRWPWAVKFLFPGLKTHYFSEHCNWSVELYAYMHMKLLEVRLLHNFRYVQSYNLCFNQKTV